MNTKQVGNLGEDIAVNYLKNKGYKILQRNWRIKQGEIDIIAKHKKRMVFVEVKTIKEKKGFLPEDEINQKKKRQLVKMAQIYLLQNRLPLNTPHQIDVLAIELLPEGAKINHIKNALEDTF